MKPTEPPRHPHLTPVGSAITPGQDPTTTNEELFANACAAHERLTSARERMVNEKTSSAAIAYCYAFSELKAARSALPKPHLVHG